MPGCSGQAVGTLPHCEEATGGIKRIVVAVDGSPAAGAAARWAAFDAAIRDVALIVVHVLPSAPEVRLQTGSPGTQIPRDVRGFPGTFANTNLHKARKFSRAPWRSIGKTIGPRRPRRISAKLCVGAVAPILSSFNHAESDLIVVGRRGRGGIHSTPTRLGQQRRGARRGAVRSQWCINTLHRLHRRGPPVVVGMTAQRPPKVSPRSHSTKPPDAPRVWSRCMPSKAATRCGRKGY